MKNQAFAKYIFSLLLFGSNGVVASLIALESIEIVLLRTMIGSLLLIALFFIGGGKMTFFKHKADCGFLALSGIAMGTSWMFLYEAYDRVGVSIATLLYSCGPVIVMILSPLLFKEKLTVNKILGFCAVAIGVVLVNGTAFEGDGDWFGFVCGLLSAATYSMMVIFNKKAKRITGLENSTLQLTIAFLAVAIFVGCKQGYAMPITAQSVLPILVLGVLNTGIGCYLYFSSIGKLKAQTVAICEYLELLSAVVFSAIFLKEMLLPLQIVGGVLIVGGAMAGELLNKKH